nr:MAG TPA: hypothetical protein [Caudoviricetes sp.]
MARQQDGSALAGRPFRIRLVVHGLCVDGVRHGRRN